MRGFNERVLKEGTNVAVHADPAMTDRRNPGQPRPLFAQRDWSIFPVHVLTSLPIPDTNNTNAGSLIFSLFLTTTRFPISSFGDCHELDIATV
jgi:hypothetical protein